MRSKLKLSIMSLSLILLLFSLSGCTKNHDFAPLPMDEIQLISPNPVIGSMTPPDSKNQKGLV